MVSLTMRKLLGEVEKEWETARGVTQMLLFSSSEVKESVIQGRHTYGAHGSLRYR